jgi:hypothetical protein
MVAAPLVIGTTTWLASDALGSAGGVGSISFGVRGWTGLAEIVLSLLATCAILVNAIRVWVHGFGRRVAALALAASLAGLAVGWFVRAEAVPWPGPTTMALATGIEVFLVAAAYWAGLHLVYALSGRPAQPLG